MNDRNVTSFPLTWPDGWKRERYRSRSRFGPTTLAQSCREVLDELRRIGVPDYSVVISTNVQLRLDGLPYSNQRSPTDPGVSVWFTLPKDKQRRVLACDKWDLVEHNMRAIARHIEALRGQERWGVGSLEQAFRGYAALPASTDDWRDVLEMRDDDGERTHQFTAEEVTDAFRRLALTYHPDVGGSHEAFLRLTAARDRAMKEINGMSHTVS